ncbi:MAG: hypothetical protein IPJ74_02720 [Saprospiraceae bacterium]|nr:hypothetical protein [Saprospiraceae bacterium]
MTIYFGLGLDDVVFPKPKQTTGAQHYLGPQGILYTLESHLGLIGHPPENEYLRIEQYRQALQAYLQKQPDVFSELLLKPTSLLRLLNCFRGAMNCCSLVGILLRIVNFPCVCNVLQNWNPCSMVITVSFPPDMPIVLCRFYKK